jgi:hypothetical protein
MLSKLFSLGLTGLLGLGVAAALPQQPPPPDDGPPPPRAKKKEDPGPQDGLRKAYHLLRRLRSDNQTAGRPEERLREWTERATVLYRNAVKAQNAGDERKAHEFGTAAHDLARAVDHARSAAQFDRSEPDPDLPPPPAGAGPETDKERVAFDLRNAYDHIRDQLDKNDPGKDAKYYNDASRDLYNAARRDAEAGRYERAGELARAADALSHVNEHVAHATGNRPEPPDNGYGFEPKEKGKEKAKAKKKADAKGKGSEPKKRPEPGDDRTEPKGEGTGGALPPPLSTACPHTLTPMTSSTSRRRVPKLSKTRRPL